jgi:4-carboxymuconolactone decarboxylase
MDERDRHKQGMATRRSVLGDAHVDRAEKNRNEFNADFQDFITRYAWGEVWARPGLDKKTRSLITIVMLVALNREAELRMHLRAAANTGVTRAEIKEAILQSGLYCGLPAANGAMHLAEEVFDTTEEWRGKKE